MKIIHFSDTHLGYNDLDILDENLMIQKEIVLAFGKLSSQEKKEATAFLEKIT